MNGLYLLAFTLLLALSQAKGEGYNVDAVCTLVKDGTKLASIESCQTFHVCQGGKAGQQSCASTESFDKNAETCKPSSQVNCYWGNKTPCAGLQGKAFVPVVGSCSGWIFCENGAEVGRGACNPGLVFANGECRYGTCQDNPNNGNPNANFHSICQIMPNNKYFGSTTDCKQWQVCRNDELDGGSCTNDMVYDPPTGFCRYEEIGTCNHANGQVIQPDEEKGGPCAVFEEGVKKASDTKCGNYFVCTNKKWVRKQCPDRTFWDVKEDRCISRMAAVTSKSCDRCQYSKALFVNAVDDAECRKYLQCNNGVRKGSVGSCAEDSYFDEGAQACIRASFAGYANKYGACKDRTDVNECVGRCGGTDSTCGVEDGICAKCPDGICNKNYCKADGECTDPSKCFVDGAVCENCPAGVDHSADPIACKPEA